VRALQSFPTFKFETGNTHMMHARLRGAVLCAWLCCTLISLEALAREAASPLDKTSASLLDSVLRWNSIAIDASGLDHTPVQEGEDRVFGEAIGPGRSSRAMAIVHIAMFDALTSIHGGYESYTGIRRLGKPALISDQAAVAQAAHDTLIAMFPSQQAAFDRELQTSMSQIPANTARKLGRMVGAEAARRILEAREHDGSHYQEPRM
jgi:hypothetical protein